MKSSELRIGNFVTHGAFVQKIRQLSENNIWGDYYETIRAKPIPITEEWLLNFGFEKREGTMSNMWLTNWIGDIKLEVFEDQRLSHKGFTLRNNFCNNMKTKLKYVHELQNLYFALTGEDLELKRD